MNNPGKCSQFTKSQIHGQGATKDQEESWVLCSFDPEKLLEKKKMSTRKLKLFLNDCIRKSTRISAFRYWGLITQPKWNILEDETIAIIILN